MNSNLARDLLAVIRDLEYERDSSVREELTYKPKERHIFLQRTGLDLSYEEQLKLLLKLAEQGAIRIEYLPQEDEMLLEVGIPSTSFRFEIIEPQFAELATQCRQNENSSSEDQIAIACRLRLKDVQLLLKIGDSEELQIAGLHEGRDPYTLFKKLLNSPDISFGRLEIFESGSVKDLWQVVSKSNLAYLKPFFEYSKDRMLVHNQIDLEPNQVILIISKINEKYRKNFDDVLKSLQNT